MEIEIPNCACGERMYVMGTPDSFACVNCDGVQAQEVGRSPKPRIQTDRDKAYRVEMEKREAEWYPEQFESKKGATGGEGQ